MTRRLRRAFTLMELIIVMAITAVLLTLIGIPLINGFNLTRGAQAFSEAQDTARLINERISRELATAAYVLDNSMPAASIEIEVPLKNAAGQFAGSYGSVFLHNAKIDFVPPSKGDPGNPLYNPGRDRIDPTLQTPIGQVNVPVARGQTLVRYWIGLRFPVVDIGGAETAGLYFNPYMPAMGGQDIGGENLFVLYRAEVAPWVYNQALGRYVPNDDFFAVDVAGNPIINDPGFFIWDRPDPPTQIPDGNLGAHQNRLRNWRDAATMIVQTVRTDMIMAEIDETSGQVITEPYPGGLFVPRVRSLVNFQPMRVTSEPARGNEVVRSGEEVIEPSTRSASEFFQTELGGWTRDTLIRYYRADPRITPPPPYYIARWRQPMGGLFENFRSEIVYFDPTTMNDEYQDGLPVFDVTGYQATVDAGNPQLRPNMFMGSGQKLVLFSVDPRRGRIYTRFPATAAFEGVPTVTPASVNATLWNWINSPTGQTNPSLGRRFVDLRRIIAAGTGFNPLSSTVMGYANPRSKIVPGSEVIFGPDQRPGPNFGRPIRYSRVAQGEPVGLNQYKINYTDILEPTDYMTFLGVPNPTPGSDVELYIQPRFMKGYVEFHSDPTLDLPLVGNITILFDFQLNEAADAIVVDYDSNQQIQVEVTIRRFSGGFDQRPQTVTVSDIVAVRNFAR